MGPITVIAFAVLVEPDPIVVLNGLSSHRRCPAARLLRTRRREVLPDHARRGDRGVGEREVATPALAAPTASSSSARTAGGSWLRERLADIISAVRCARVSSVDENADRRQPGQGPEKLSARRVAAREVAELVPVRAAGVVAGPAGAHGEARTRSSCRYAALTADLLLGVDRGGPVGRRIWWPKLVHWSEGRWSRPEPPLSRYFARLCPVGLAIPGIAGPPLSVNIRAAPSATSVSQRVPVSNMGGP